MMLDSEVLWTRERERERERERGSAAVEEPMLEETGLRSGDHASRSVARPSLAHAIHGMSIVSVLRCRLCKIARSVSTG